ncbi:helix-turn-helix domain-containing protein [Antrihabitans stalactiti]|uniref:AraC family transcriptional regulator n=1 Tax=Antrihabitans stalactiti TaxID=2584121 RepID=A0A848KBZ5_9NOCA|nr:AraC family transcriptional regulator [Antrihabitans stalactiti]NMN95831.1 AraC family transcriptional regulator [Antrihabitans stalactiti]
MVVAPVWAVPRGTEGVRIMVEAGIAHGMTAAECLVGTGLTEGDLNDENAEIWAHQEFDVIRNLVARLGDRPGVGIEVGLHSTIGRSGVIGFMLLAGPTLREAVERAIPFLALSPTHLRFSIESDADDAYVFADDSELPADVRPFVVERDVAGLAAALRGAQVDFVPRRLETTLDSERAALLGEELRMPPDCVHAHQRSNRLVLPRSMLDLRLPQADANTARAFERQCQDLLERRLARVGIAGQVRSRLLHNPGELPSMPAVADGLHIDPRTLRRRLAAEGTSFRELLDEVRRKRAIELLATELTVEEIAKQLGYAETANFTHAFKRWEGTAPSYFRAGGRAGADSTSTAHRK